MSVNFVNDSIISLGPTTTHISFTRFNSLSQEERIELLNQYKLPNENLYLTDIPLGDIDIESIRLSTKTYINNFFKFKNYLNPFNYSKHFHFSKACWLTSELIKDGKFRSKIGAHYNPRTKKVVIHPGTQRFRILDLFNKTNDEFILFWNTNEVRFKWMYETDIIELDNTNQVFKDYFFGLTTDHGSLIPHFCLEQDGPMDEASFEFFNKIQDICKKIKIKTNIEYKILKDFSDSKDYNCEIIYKNDKKSTYYKSLFIAFSNSSYEDEDVLVKTNIY